MERDNLIEANFGNIPLMEEMYSLYLRDPQSVDPSWQKFFQEVDTSSFSFKSPSKQPKSEEEADLRIANLVQAYRMYGHLMAKTNPIQTHPAEEPKELKLETLGFDKSELSKMFPTYGILPESTESLQKIIDTLKSIYCDKIGVEYAGLQKHHLENWLQQQIEPTRFRIDLSIDQKKMILEKLNRSELFESFLHTRYVGQKRFSLEGGETLIPMLEAIIETGALLGLEEFILGMAHRGRLNVLANILKKSYSDIFSEFEEGYIPQSIEGSGDVKYHKGFYSEALTFQGHPVFIALTPNPSHLESVDPVVEGYTRAKQTLKNDLEDHCKVVPILVHGDAAIAGQGVVYETLQLYNLPGYSTGGTIHIVINNQIGFTTIPKDSRSTRYCTDIARAFGAPVFHVNAEDPEGCVYATILATELRQKFHCDVFIDLNCYRKYGHNETDEPAFTQPLEYQLIRKKKTIREIYRDDLIHQGVLEKEMAESLEKEFKQDLLNAQKTQKESNKSRPVSTQKKVDWQFKEFQTAVPLKTLQEVAERFCIIPEGFKIHPKLGQLLKERLEMVNPREGGKAVDWGMGELLAYATLLWEGTSIRLTGQDCCRGTFSHRHAMWVDQEKEQDYIPLKYLKSEQGRFDLFNSPLSEFAALGFEFGYSTANPDALVIWEAQFGDFANGAQVVIDQFITPSEQKWGQKSRLVLYLPHGYEGQGPEHSSARIERFLSLAGNENIQVVNPTTPAQLFHLLRRQMKNSVLKPLIVATPKGLLRHPSCVSPLSDFTKGTFQEILDDPSPPKICKRLAFCSGRLYYDLEAERLKVKSEDLAIVRIEQLYPLNMDKLKEIMTKYADCQEYIWIQEEPSNMGAWGYISSFIQGMLPNDKVLQYIGRSRSAATAVGSHQVHKKEHEELLEKLFQDFKPSIFEIAGQHK